jgi:hypothetical protein
MSQRRSDLGIQKLTTSATQDWDFLQLWQNGLNQLTTRPNDIQKFFEAWWRTGTAIVGTIATALAALKIPSDIAYAIAIIVFAAGTAAAIIAYRREVRQKDQNEPSVLGADNKLRSKAGGFRGLRRFLRGERLPGPQRRRDAAQLFRQIDHPDFKIALVTGDSGAGKSSLLECALVDALETADFRVVMISNSSASVPPNTTDADLPQIQLVINDFASRVADRRTQGGKGVVLILDQFEELLSRFRVERDRDTLGEGLWKLIADGTRVVVGMRKEYVVDFKSIAKMFRYTFSFGDTFLVENFDPKEAADVIRECAQEDGVTPDLELPELIAEDLAVDGRVRPADLQIICTALSGDLTTDRYRSEGRAAGLRSRFVKSVIGITGDPVLARAVLRELCDIPNNKKAPNPLCAEEIATKARAGAPGPRATTETVTSVLQALEQARVVVKTDSSDSAQWSLIHDYLVEPIKLATEEQSTRSEAAIARLDYFVARVKTSRNIIIPLAELSAIRRDAPPAAVRQPAARRLIRRSLLIGYGRPFIGASAAALAAIAGVVAIATERQWQVVDERNHWEGLPKRTASRVTALTTVLNGQNKPTVIMGTDNFRGGSKRLSLWDPETGASIGVQTGRNLSIIKGYIWDYDSTIGHLAERDTAGRDVWGVTIPEELRPASKDGEDDDEVELSEDGENLILRRRFSDSQTIFDIHSRKATIFNRDKVSPKIADTDRPFGNRTTSTRSSKFLHAVAMEVANTTRVTVWSFDYENTVFDEQFKGGFEYLDLTDLETRSTVTIVHDSVFEIVRYKPHFR